MLKCVNGCICDLWFYILYLCELSKILSLSFYFVVNFDYSDQATKMCFKF